MQKSGDNRVAFVGDDDEELVGSLLGALEQRGIRAMRMPVASLKRAPRPPALTVLLESVIEDGGAIAAESIGLERGPYAVLMGPGALAQRLEARQRGFHIIPRKDDAAEIADFIERLVAQGQIGSATTPDGLPLGQMVSSMSATLGRSAGAPISESVRIKPEAQADARSFASGFAKEIGALAEKAQPSKPPPSVASQSVASQSVAPQPVAPQSVASQPVAPPSVALDDLDWDDDPETVERPEGAALAEWRKHAKLGPGDPANVSSLLPVPVPPPKRDLPRVSPVPPPKREAGRASPRSAPRPPQTFGMSKGRGLPRPARGKEPRRDPMRTTLPGGVSIPPELLDDSTPAQPIELDDVTSPGGLPLSMKDVHAAITKPHEIEPDLDPQELTTRQIVSPPVDEEETAELTVAATAALLDAASPAPPASLSGPPSGMLPEAELASAFDEALADVDADVTAPQAALHIEGSAEVLARDERGAPGPPSASVPPAPPSASVPPAPPSASVPPAPPSASVPPAPPSASVPPVDLRAAGSLPPPPPPPEGAVAELPPEAPVAAPTRAPTPKRGMGVGLVVGLAAVTLLGLLALGGAGAVYWYMQSDLTVPIAASDPQSPSDLGLSPPTPAEPTRIEPTPGEPGETPPSAVEPVPGEALPAEALLAEAGPTEALPTEALPTEAAPTEAAPTEAAPTGVPTEAVPTEAVPTEAVPTEAVPVDAVPTEAAPNEAAPTEAAPPRVAPPPASPNAEAVPTDPEVARERSDAIVDEAEAQERAGQLTEARASFERAVEMYDRNPHAHAGLARVELAAGDAAAAVDHAERAASLRRRRPEYQILVGDARRASGDAAGARRAYQRALDIDPSYTDAQQRLAE